MRKALECCRGQNAEGDRCCERQPKLHESGCVFIVWHGHAGSRLCPRRAFLVVCTRFGVAGRASLTSRYLDRRREPRSVVAPLMDFQHAGRGAADVGPRPLGQLGVVPDRPRRQRRVLVGRDGHGQLQRGWRDPVAGEGLRDCSAASGGRSRRTPRATWRTTASSSSCTTRGTAW